MKEAVLKLIQDEIDSFDHPSAARTAMRMLFNKVSALPEQGYTREQVLKVVQNNIDMVLKERDEFIGKIAGASEAKVKLHKINLSEANQRYLAFDTIYKQLSSLTPVAVEAERTERWIPVSERLPDARPGWSHSTDVIVCITRNEGVFCTVGAYSYQHKRWEQHLFDPKYSENITHWMPFDDPPKDSLAPQVN